MQNYSKAIAGLAGGVTGTGLVIALVQSLPDGSSPWAYVAMAAVGGAVACVFVYFAPANKPS